MKRLFTYLKPHTWTMAAATFLVLLIIVVELYRPIIIGDAIDRYINGYYTPYVEAEADEPGAVAYREIYLTRAKGTVAQTVVGKDMARPSGMDGSASIQPEKSQVKEEGAYYQIFLYNDKYYMAERVTKAECEALESGGYDLFGDYVEQGRRCFPERI